MEYTYLSLAITALGSFSKAVSAPKKKQAEPSMQYNLNFTIKYYHINQHNPASCVYGGEIRGPLSMHNCTAWDEHPTEVLHEKTSQSIRSPNKNAKQCM